MACSSDDQLQQYVDGELSSIEQCLLRDHLLACPTCRRRSEIYAGLKIGL